jgi:membrane protein DedA with SNARE-associated domain/rhodanese-related sulfurtransferase
MELLSDILHRHGALVVLGVVFAEQLGLPVPALPLLLAAGVLIGTGHLDWAGVFAAAMLATIVADGIWYVAGRWRGRSVLSMLCRIALEADSCIRRTETFFVKHGAPSLILAKFIPGLSTIAPPLAGVMGLSFSAFLLYDGLGAFIWVGSGVGFGYAFSDRVEQAAVYAEHITPALALTLGTGIAAYALYRAISGRRRLKGVPRISVEELADRLGGEDAPLLIDVRAPEAIQAEPGLPGAVSLSLEDLDRRHGTISRGRALVLYCACPGDVGSALAATRLQRLGFKQIHVLQGGLTAWQARLNGGSIRKQVPLVSLAT